MEQRNPFLQPLPIFSILPPDASGIADYSYMTFKNSPTNIHFFHHFPSFKSQLEFNSKSKNQVFHPRLFPLFHKLLRYQKVVFILGNSSHHVTTLNFFLHESSMIDCQKYIYLHDVQLINLWYAYFKNNIEELKLFLIKFYPENEKEIAFCDSREQLFQCPVYGIRPLMAMSQSKKILVNSDEARQLVIQELGKTAAVDCDKLFLPIIEESPPHACSKQQNTPCIGHFGMLNAMKHADTLLEACKILNARRPIKLIFAGFHLKSSLHFLKLTLPDFVTVFESPAHEELKALMQQVDIAVQLRWPTDGGISGVVNQLLGLNKPVIATNRGFFGELKDALVLTPEGISSNDLAKVIEQTLDHKEKLIQNIMNTKAKFSLKTFFQQFHMALELDRVDP